MNYQESKKILAEIKKAKRILLNCHRGPDPDSIGSALALHEVLIQKGKDIDIVCPSEQLYENISFLKGYKRIQRDINFSRFDFDKYELFITLDSSDWQQVTGDKSIPLPEIPLVVIDHHVTNSRYGEINLVDSKTTSVGEILHCIFQDWGSELNKNSADCLMAAIIGDTGAFRFPGVTPRTFRVAGDLIKLGANKDKIIFEIFHSEELDLLKYYAEVLSRIKVDVDGKFVWSTIPYDIYDKLSDKSKGTAKPANIFAQKVKDTNFGFVMVEKKKRELNVSFRSRTGFDTSKIAVELGGGGHPAASGARIEIDDFDKTVNKVLSIAREYAKEYKKTDK